MLSGAARSRVATDHAPHARQEKDVPFEEAPFGVTGLETAFAALYVPRPTRRHHAGDAARADVGGPARAFGLDEPRIESERARTSSCSTSTRNGRSPRTASAPCVRTRGSWGRRCAAASQRRSPTAGWCSSMKPGYVVLEDGTVFRGRSVGAEGVAFGEAVFTTGMTGYQGAVTDPSYAAQLVCFRQRWSATTAWPTSAKSPARRTRRRPSCARSEGRSGRTCASTASSDWRGSTRARSSCASASRAPCGLRPSRTSGRSPSMPHSSRCARSRRWRAGARRAGLDARGLRLHGRRLSAWPWSTTARSAPSCAVSHAPAAVSVVPHVLVRQLASFDGVVLSNGPGDPEPLHAEVEAVRGALGRVPILGICLGHQLLGLATGHRTYKLPFGHRGSNHPVLERASGRARDEPEPRLRGRCDRGRRGYARLALRRHRRGLRLPRIARAFVQFHPEAGPGPHDAWPILESFVQELRG